MAESATGRTDLSDAVANGDLAHVAAVLDADPQRIREVGANGCGLLSLAVRSGHTPVMALLLARGADPTWAEPDAPRGAALHAAARAGRRDMVDMLLRHGADPNAHVDSGGNAVFAAARFPEIRALIEAHGGTLDPYDLVWLDEDDEALRRIVAEPESAFAGCGGVYTAVVTRRKHDLLLRLLDAGVRVPAKPCGCRSYLLEDAGMLRLLLARGGLDPDYTDETGATLLHALSGDRGADPIEVRVQCAEILLAAGADVEARDDSGLTPLELAKRHNVPALVTVFERAQRV